MKILVISNLFPPDFLGGYEMGCRQVVQALRTAGHDVVVLTSVPRSRPVPAEPGTLRRLRLIDVYDSFSEWKAVPAAKAVHSQEACGIHAYNVHALLDVVQEFQPDVAYVWNVISLGGLGLLAALQHVGVPWVMHLMDRVPAVLCALSLNGDTLAPVAATFKKLCRGRFICCSQTALQEIYDSGVDITDRTRIIPNWVTTTPASRTVYRCDGHLRIVFAGSMAAFKGVGILIEAAALLRNRGQIDFSLDIYGFGEDYEFRSLIRKLQIQDHVCLRGSRTQAELDRLYKHYDLFGFPTWAREPMAFAPLEAAAHGCVPILSSVCGNSEWFVDGVDCLKADRTPEAFADVIERVQVGDVSLAEIGARGAKVIRRDFHLSVVLPKIEAELRAAVRYGGGPARSADEAYRMALIAEKSLACLIHETFA